MSKGSSDLTTIKQKQSFQVGNNSPIAAKWGEMMIMIVQTLGSQVGSPAADDDVDCLYDLEKVVEYSYWRACLFKCIWIRGVGVVYILLKIFRICDNHRLQFSSFLRVSRIFSRTPFYELETRETDNRKCLESDTVRHDQDSPNKPLDDASSICKISTACDVVRTSHDYIDNFF